MSATKVSVAGVEWGCGNFRNYGGLTSPQLKGTVMTDVYPVQALRTHLEAARLAAIEALANDGNTPSIESLLSLATIQTALTAVIEEVESHRVKVGGGSEQELK